MTLIPRFIQARIAFVSRRPREFGNVEELSFENHEVGWESKGELGGAWMVVGSESMLVSLLGFSRIPYKCQNHRFSQSRGDRRSSDDWSYKHTCELVSHGNMHASSTYSGKISELNEVIGNLLCRINKFTISSEIKRKIVIIKKSLFFCSNFNLLSLW